MCSIIQRLYKRHFSLCCTNMTEEVKPRVVFGFPGFLVMLALHLWLSSLLLGKEWTAIATACIQSRLTHYPAKREMDIFESTGSVITWWHCDQVKSYLWLPFYSSRTIMFMAIVSKWFDASIGTHKLNPCFSWQVAHLAATCCIFEFIATQVVWLRLVRVKSLFDGLTCDDPIFTCILLWMLHWLPFILARETCLNGSHLKLKYLGVA